MKEFITKNFISLLALGLLVVIYFQQCGNRTIDIKPPTRDTVETIIHHYYEDTTKSKPTVVNKIYPTTKEIPIQMQPDTNYQKLFNQYNSLLSEYYSKSVVLDSLKIDTFGIVKTEDSLTQNKITGRKWTYKLDIPEKIREITVTQYAKPKNKIYLGGGLLGSKDQLVSGINTGILFQNKKDQIFKAGIQFVKGQPVTYQTSSYWKIKL